jgi:2-phospho-L-lactate/phosphoenolpyruvate guanylyltransferase
MDAGLLPVKSLANAKSRLEPAITGADRLALAQALLEDALSLIGSVDILRWWVVTDDREVARHARDRGHDVIEDAGTGINDAIATAVAQLPGETSSLTVVPADVPLAWKGDIEDLLDTGATSDLVVVPSARDGGTNALYLSPPDLIAPRFGEASLRQHVAAAEDAGLRCSILSLPRLELDIDTIADVDELLTRKSAGTSKAVELLRKLRS